MTGLVVDRLVDGHVHFWDRSRLDYPWLTGLGIDGPYLPAQLPAAIGDAAVEGCVFVQADCREDQSRAEVEWVAEVAGPSGRVRGIVARIALEREGAGGELARVAATERVVGVRRNIQGESPGFASEIAAGVSRLAAHGLSFDLCCTFDQLDEVVALVAEAPADTRFVLDHLGKPAVGDGAATAAWSRGIGQLAAHANVWCKLSGLLTEGAGSVTAADAAPYLDRALAEFGTERVFFGSDWPVCTLGGTYAAWVEMVAAAVGTDPAAQRSVFVDNVQRFYGLTAD